MKIVRTISELKKEICRHKEEGRTIGLVPTMGALHKGHHSLVEKARSDNDIVVVSIFVNPTQFNNQEDLVKYPRDEKNDFESLKADRVDIVFAPSDDEVYPVPDNRIFDLGKVAEVMEGGKRPGHFNGVAQIVSKLFDWVQPDRAYFGEKDFQQIAVIKRLKELIGSPVEIIECPIVRDTDGLALSSRNLRLNSIQRESAPNIHRILSQSAEWKECGMTPDEIIAKVTMEINKDPNLNVEYYSIVDASTLVDLKNWHDSESYPVGCIAVYCGNVRLIDNIKYQ